MAEKNANNINHFHKKFIDNNPLIFIFNVNEAKAQVRKQFGMEGNTVSNVKLNGSAGDQQ